MGDTSHAHSVERRKAGEDKGITTSHPKSTMGGSRSHMRHKIAIPNIKIVTQMWYEHPIHEALTIQQGKPIFKETRSNEEFVNMGTPLTEIEEFRTLHQAIMRVHQHIYPHERSDAIPGHQLHFTQLPKHVNVKQDTGLFKGFHITIRFNT